MIAGGVSGVLRFGDTAIKPITDVAEAEWTQAAFAALPTRPDVRWAQPIATSDGRWVADGWIANEFVDRLTPTAPDWPSVIDLGERLHDATSAIEPPIAMLAARPHRWARGERYAFDEESGLTMPDDAVAIDRLLVTWCAPEPAPAQVVHVDLATNVFLDPTGTPVVLDISPGHRSRRYASAVVVADALLWSGASPDLLHCLGDVMTAHGPSRASVALPARDRADRAPPRRTVGARRRSEPVPHGHRGVVLIGTFVTTSPLTTANPDISRLRP